METFKLRIDEDGNVRYALTIGRTYFKRTKEELVPDQTVYARPLSSTKNAERAGQFTSQQVNSVASWLQKAQEKDPAKKFPVITVE